MTLKTRLFAGLIPLCLIAATAQAEDLYITLVNDTPATVTHFYTSPVGVDSWEEDVLGAGVIAPGETVQLVIADGRDVCEYDMLFVVAVDGEAGELVDTQDLCALGTYTLVAE